MRRGESGVCASLALAAVLLGAPALAADDDVVGEVLEILKQRGLVDQQEYERLALKNAAYEDKQSQGNLMSRLEWYGDMRLRLENLWGDATEASSADHFDRTRGRYRLRFGANVPINEYVKTGFRLASGNEGGNRSTNTSFGEDRFSNSDPDNFAPDEIWIDRAFIQLTAPRSWIGEDVSLKVVGGKQSNPFRWKHGKDYLLWDGDINPEGGAVQVSWDASETMSLFANGGYFIMEEDSSDRDPHVLGLQAGVTTELSEDVEVGGRLSWYEWHSLDGNFFDSGIGNGNLNGGLTSGGFGGTGDGSTGNDGISAGELAAYLRYGGIENWPLLVFGHYARNFDAESLVLSGAGDTGWGVGLEVGEKKKYVVFGAGYYRLEANFWPAAFVDSDLTNGVTNRKAWTVYASRQVLSNTDLTLTLFRYDPIRNRIPPYLDSVSQGENYKLQTDLLVKF